MSTTNELGIGDIPRLTTLFENAAGVAYTPSSLTARWLAPDGRVGTVTPVQNGATVGTVITDLPEVDQRGRWWWWIDGDGVADDGWFDVDTAPASLVA